jgi:hypothetical protein
MGRSERKAEYHLLSLMRALVMGCLLVVVLMGPMGAAQANQQRPHANKADQNKKKTVQVTAAGENNYRVKGDGNPIVYKSVDSRPDFNGGNYAHVLRCEPGYEAIGGGFDLNNPDWRLFGVNHWRILASRPGNEHGEDVQRRGETWVVEAFGHVVFPKGSTDLPKFTAYAACAPKKLLPGLRYVSESTTLGLDENKTTWATCGRDERVIGGGFEFGSRDVNFVRSERSRENELSWGSGAKNYASGGPKVSIKSWAVCVSRGALEATQYKEGVDRSNNRPVANTQSCSQGTYLLSGGAGMPNNDFDSPSSPLLSNSSPPKVGEQSWKASAVQIGRGDFTVHAFALCGRFAEGGG